MYRIAHLLTAVVLAFGVQFASAQTAVVVRPPAAPGPTVVAVTPVAPVARAVARQQARKQVRRQARKATRRTARRTARRTVRRAARRG